MRSAGAMASLHLCCETAVLAGTPDHRDTLLTPEERADGSSMMICVSRALTSRLTLDL